MLMQESQTHPATTRTIEPPVEGHSRSLQRSPVARESALRKIVHDYVAGWGIVRTQSPRERRRKQRVWNRRSSERHPFCRPVWVHTAHWEEDSAPSTSAVIVHPQDEMFLVHDISSTGIGLTSDRAPKSRLLVLEFDSWTGKPVEIVVYLHWRRRVAPLDYRCGGCIIGVLMPNLLLEFGRQDH